VPTATATLHPESRTVAPADPSLMAPAEVLGRVSVLVAELDPGDEAWHSAGPHLSAVVSAVRHALDGSGSPIAADEEVSAILRLRELACTAQRAAGSTGVAVPAEAVSGHLAALAQAALR